MAPEARSKRSSLKAKSTPSTDWLPYQDEPKYTAKSIRTRDLKPLAQHDWFASLALAMKQHGDDVQSKMVVKLYYFLLDFIPQALNEGYRHISGKNVMEYLLCHTGEYQFSRHRICKNVDTAFKNLEKWMRLGNDWQDALKNATDLAYQHGGRAPGLHSPAGMLAILVIAYPDSDKVASLKRYIKRLQIEWMTDQPRDDLSVTEGFWKGVNSRNVLTVFAEEKLEQTANSVTMLADYEKLFGSEFSHCRNDMRPYLQDWASHLTLGGSFTSDQRQSADSLSIDGDNSSIGSHGSSPRDDPEDILPPLSISKLRRHLNPTAKDSMELGDWLIGKLAQEADGSVFSTWCRYWEGRIDKAASYQEQMIIRSLFIQSLRRIESLDSAPEAAPVADVYALLDMGDGTSAFNQCRQEALQSLDELQVYKACTQSNHQLRQLIESGDNRDTTLVWAEKCFTQQVYFFSDFSKTSPFFAQYKKVIKLDTWRTDVLINGFENLHEVNRDEVAFWRSNQESLLTDKAIATLMLTSWQFRSLLLPGGDCQTVLTDWQYLVFRQSICPNPSEPTPVDISEYRLMPIINTALSGSTVQLRHRSLHKLLGDVKQPQNVSSLFSVANGCPFQTPSSNNPPLVTSPHVASTNSPEEDTLAISRRKSDFSRTIELLPAKRKATVDERNSKIPRLGLRHELNADLRQSNTEMRTHLQHSIESLKMELKRANDDLLSGLRYSLNEVKDEIHTCCDELRKNVQASGEAVQKETVKNITEELAQTQTILLSEAKLEFAQFKADIITKQNGLLRQVQEIKASLGSAPERPGDDGYLASRCPAPSGWDQKAYEALLLRASWYFIFQLGLPEDGVALDPLMLEDTLDKFSDIASEDHLMAALEHAHVQAYRCPLREIAECS